MTIRYPLAVLLALVSAGLLVACGGDGETTTTETVTASPSDETTTDTPSETTPDASETTTEEPDGYPQRVRDNFMASCEGTSGGNTAACECALEKIEETVSLEEFVKIDADVRAGVVTSPPREVTDAIAACLDE